MSGAIPTAEVLEDLTKASVLENITVLVKWTYTARMVMSKK